MARKKRQPPRRRPKQPPGSESVLPGPLPDPRVIEGIMRKAAAGILGRSKQTPLSKAQDLVYQAFDQPDPARRAEMAHEALKICPDCADALVLLAEQAPTRKEALDLYQRAVAAAERTLGPDIFRDEVGHFWGLLETRPYMRACEGLAHTLWILGHRDEAAERLQELLRLNPNDNQGVRYILADWLIDLNRDDELGRLLASFDESTAAWIYTRALSTFRQQGDSPEARTQLKAAQKANEYVPAMLLGEHPIPLEQPSYYQHGHEDEAIVYAQGGLSAWRSTPGALAWLRKATQPVPARAPSADPPGVGPTALAKVRLNRLPQTFDIWQVDFRRIPTLVKSSSGELVQPWMTFVASSTTGAFLAQSMTENPPSSATVWDAVVQGMRVPMQDEPHRPTQLEILPGPVWDELRPHLDAIGVDCTEADEMHLIDALIEDMKNFLAKDKPPGLLDMPGMTADRVGRFYQAAAEFYRRAPWKSLGYEVAIRVETDQFDSGPWYAVVMGQTGMTLGVALYDDLKLLRRLWTRPGPDEDNARRTVALTMTFDPQEGIPPADLLAAREHGWEVADPEAYPLAFKKERGMSMRPPLAWELTLLEACLRAIPDFIAAHRPGDTTPHRTTVPTTAGGITLVLSWIDED